MSATIDRETLEKQIRERIDLLPQRDVIEKDDLNQWVNYMVSVMPNEAMWHVTRAAGIGGSEIGGLVKNYLGHRADFMFSAHDWAESKLLRRHPEPSGGALQRGLTMEEIHRQHLHKAYNVSRDVDAFQTLSKSHSQGREYLRYSPDDLVNFKEPTVIDIGEQQVEVEGLILIDYKSPTTVNTDGASFTYACQLHQGALIAEENGIELAGTILSQWDWANWTMHNDLVAINPELQEMIRRASDYYWNSVLEGVIPAYIHAQRYELNPKTKEDWREAVERFSMLNALKTQLDNQAKALRSTIQEGLGLERDRLEGEQVVFDGLLKISATARIDEDKVREALPDEVLDTIEVKSRSTTYDTPALVRHVKELGIDVKPFVKPTRIDQDKAYNALAEHGLNPEDFMTESHRFSTDRAVSTKARLWVESNFPPIKTPEIPPLEFTATENSAAALESEQANQSAPTVALDTPRG